MFREKYRRYILWGATILIPLLLAITCYFTFLRWGQIVASWKNITHIMAPVSAGLIIAYLLDALVNTFSRLFDKLPSPREPKRKKLKKLYRGLSIALAEICFVVLISTLIHSILPQLIDSLMTIISNINQYTANLEEWGRPYLEDYPDIAPFVLDQTKKLEIFITDILENDLLTLITRVANGLLDAGTYVYNFLLGMIVSIYLLSSKNRLIGHFKKLLYTLFPTTASNRMLEIGRYTNKVFKGFLVGKIVDSIIIGILCFIGTTLLGIPYSLLISIVVGVTNLIPYFGPFIGAIPSALLVLMLDPYKCLVFIIFIIVLQQLDGNLIGPKILGNTTGISSLGVLISILISGGLFGLVGMLFAVPVYAVLYSLIKSSAENKLTRGGLPTDTDTYITLGKIDPDSGNAVSESSVDPKEASLSRQTNSLFKKLFNRKK